MPAAMRAEVRMSALAHGVCIGGNPRTRRPGPQAFSAVVGNDRRERDANPPAVGGVVRHARAVFHALVDVVPGAGGRAADTADRKGVVGGKEGAVRGYVGG